jgi:hypothetical protein
MQSRRLVAFASIPKNVTDGQLQFNVLSDSEQSFYVPRVIVTEKMPRLKGERKVSVRPSHLKDILTRLPTQRASEMDQLLPHRWQPV